MPQVGPLEFLVVAMIALIVFGPEKLPSIARSIGRTLNELRRMATEVKTDFEEGLRDDPEPPLPDQPPAVTPERDGKPE